MYFLLDGVFCMYLLGLSGLMFKAKSINFLSDDVFIDVSGMLKSPTIIVLL